MKQFFLAILGVLLIPATVLAATYFTSSQRATLLSNGFTSPTKTQWAGTDWLYEKNTSGGCRVLIMASDNTSQYYVLSTGANYQYAWPVTRAQSVRKAISFANDCL